MQFSIQKKESGEKHVNITPLNGTMPNYTPQPPGTHFAWGLEVGETHWEVWRSKRSSQLSLLEVEKVVRIFEKKHELRMNMELWTYIADNLKGEVCTAAAVQELWTYIIWEWILHYIKLRMTIEPSPLIPHISIFAQNLRIGSYIWKPWN